MTFLVAFAFRGPVRSHPWIGQTLVRWQRASVTAEDWAACSDPEPMICAIPVDQYQRELRLFAIACARRVWRLLPPSSWVAVEVHERFIDGRATTTEVESIMAVAAREAETHYSGGRSPDARAYAESAAQGVSCTRPVTTAMVLSVASCAALAAACATADPCNDADYDRVFDAARLEELSAQAAVLRALIRLPE